MTATKIEDGQKIAEKEQPPARTHRIDLTHAIALHQAASHLTGTWFPSDAIKRILRELKPLCYVCRLMKSEECEKNLCYICGLSWLPRFEELLEQNEAAIRCATAAARRSNTTAAPSPGCSTMLPRMQLCRSAQAVLVCHVLFFVV